MARTIRVSVLLLTLLSSAFVRGDELDETKGTSPGRTESENTDESQQPRLEETVVVSATRSPRLAEELPVSTSVLTRADVQESPGVSVDEVLRSVPGIAITPTNSRVHYPTRSRASMRGIPGYSTLVMIDGVLINDPHRGYPEWNKVIAQDIERIEVVRGANASLWGNYALGGTINIVTRPVDRSELTARASWGSDDTAQLNLNVAHAWSEHGGVSLDYDLYDTEGFQRALPEIRGPIDIPNWAKQTNLQLKADLRASSGTRNTLRINQFADERSQGTPLGFNERDVIDLSWNGVSPVRESGALTYAVFFQDQNFEATTTSLSANRDSETLATLSNTDSESVGGSMQWSRTSSGRLQLVSVGLDIRRSDAVEARDSFRGSTTTTVLSGGEHEIAGLFGLVGWRPFDRTELIASARIDLWRSRGGFEQTLPDPAVEYPSNTTVELDPRISVRREIGDRSAIRGSIYRAFRAPELRDLYRTGGGRGRTIIPNPFLDPEILTGAEIGYVASGRRWSAEATLFRNELSGTISEVTLTTSPLVLQAQNLGEARSNGAEVLGDLRFDDRWSLSGGYSYTDTEVTHNPNDSSIEGKDLVDVPRHLFTAQLRYRGTRGLRAELRARYSSRTYLDANNTLILDPHAIADLSTSFPVTRRIEVFIIGENLLDREYVAEITADPRLGAPRQFSGGVRVDIPFGRKRASSLE